MDTVQTRNTEIENLSKIVLSPIL